MMLGAKFLWKFMFPYWITFIPVRYETKSYDVPKSATGLFDKQKRFIARRFQ